nr:zf-CCHC domain-containing protein/UBN2 domain-containing protein [Tanacetum cinerariifolium]
MCKTTKDIWQPLLITHQGNIQVKDNKIDLLVQQYEKFTILEEESIDSGFARFNTIITSLKALDEGFSSKNYVRKFLRALHPKWRAKVTTIKKLKDLSSQALDELIGNLKVHEIVIEKDSKIYRGKKERIKSIALKAKKESSDDETLTYGSDDEEYAMAVRNFKKFFRRKGKFVTQPREENRSFRQRDGKKGKTKIKRPSLEVLGAIAKMTPRTKLTMKLVSWLNRQMSANSLREMLNNQKSSSCKTGLGFDSSKESTSGTKPINFVESSAENAPDGSTIKVHGSTITGFVDPSSGEKVAKHVFSLPMSSRSDFLITRMKLIHNKIEQSKKPSLKPSPKSSLGYVKTESMSKMPPPRRNNFSQPRHNIPQPRRNSREPIQQNFYHIN